MGFSVLLKIMFCTKIEHLYSKVTLEINVVLRHIDNGPLNYLAITKSLKENVRSRRKTKQKISPMPHELWTETFIE